MNEQIRVDAIPRSQARTARTGVAYGLAAYLWWGLAPIYFKTIAEVSATEVLAHRIVWSVVLLLVWMRIRGRWRMAAAALRNGPTLVTLLGTTVLIAVNWFFFIWAVANDQVLQASLGYFINPLVTVLLGFVFLGERLRRWQKFSVVLATLGVLNLTLGYGRPPWIAMVLAGTFAFYGLLRKTVRVDALAGLTAETALLCPLALGYLVYLGVEDRLALGSLSSGMDLLLLLAGVVTALPLLWFTNAAKRLRLATLGFLQYVAPSGHFLLAVVVYSEPFTRSHMITFALLWTALAIYSLDTARSARGMKQGHARPD